MKTLTNLELLRREAGMTQKELARRAGITGAYLSTIESGRRRPSPTLAVRLAAIVGGYPSTLLDDPFKTNASAVQTTEAR